MQHSTILHAVGEPHLAVKQEQAFRRVCSDVSTLAEGVMNLAMRSDDDHSNNAAKVDCECCGMSEDCTPTYIRKVRDFFCGKWLCGICSEAVKEKMKRPPLPAMEEALESHMAFCKQFNRTTRLNPQLSLAGAMREIARKSSQRRHSSEDSRPCVSKITARSLSCVPRKNVPIRRPQIQ